ncbi:low molecular weight phosphotyrosine protein phosphatase [Chitinophaga sedimenti]|uniref:low molecular weight protein-tyrosine-phosphatase n=1 Tax=Chitinophaga sedimenti TaxID=2033606 RepID=UPI0020051244|nr:low molecular weight protein-tyrosine-phosphatase [Chitinophaga sedimenti]MCK7559545.1 low molecular weight phosphotyrosine protein phosphatase [Chitinophaga sedimenti]
MRILMVCLGNICRSPLAEGIMRHLSTEQQLDWTIDSAGTGNWHVGDPPDARSVRVAKKYGIDISGLRGRQFRVTDFDAFDRIYVMDLDNYRDVLRKARHEDDRNKVQLLLDHQQPVPDPWYDDALFEPVYQLILGGCKRILDTVTTSK